MAIRYQLNTGGVSNNFGDDIVFQIDDPNYSGSVIKHLTVLDGQVDGGNKQTIILPGIYPQRLLMKIGSEPSAVGVNNASIDEFKRFLGAIDGSDSVKISGDVSTFSLGPGGGTRTANKIWSGGWVQPKKYRSKFNRIDDTVTLTAWDGLNILKTVDYDGPVSGLMTYFDLLKLAMDKVMSTSVSNYQYRHLNNLNLWNTENEGTAAADDAVFYVPDVLYQLMPETGHLKNLTWWEAVDINICKRFNLVLKISPIASSRTGSTTTTQQVVLRSVDSYKNISNPRYGFSRRNATGDAAIYDDEPTTDLDTSDTVFANVDLDSSQWVIDYNSIEEGIDKIKNLSVQTVKGFDSHLAQPGQNSLPRGDVSSVDTEGRNPLNSGADDIVDLSSGDGWFLSGEASGTDLREFNHFGVALDGGVMDNRPCIGYIWDREKSGDLTDNDNKENYFVNTISGPIGTFEPTDDRFGLGFFFQFRGDGRSAQNPDTFGHSKYSIIWRELKETDDVEVDAQGFVTNITSGNRCSICARY